MSCIGMRAIWLRLQLVRYYGYYSNVARGKKKKEEHIAESEVSWKPECIEVTPRQFLKN